MDAISCLAPPPPALLPTAAFADAAIARALHFTTSLDSSASASASSSSSSSLTLSHHHHHHSPLLADLPSPSPCPYYLPPHAATCCDDSVLVVSDSPRRRRRSSPTGRQTTPHHHHPQAPAAGARAGKRRSRASKRAPTTYISTDPANFRLMVQQITGVQADAASDVDVVVMLQVQQATAAFDAAALLGNHPQLLPAGDEAPAALRQHQLQLQQQQQQPCFPTLDSWNVMYETNSAEML